MNRLKFYKFSAIGLFILNIVLVAAFLIVIPKGDHRPSHRINVKDHFNMDEQQHKMFQQKAELHHAEMREIGEKQEKLLKPYFFSISEEEDNNSQAFVMEMVKELEEKKVASIYRHLEDVKSILNKEQLPLFDTFLKNRLETMLSPKGKRPHKR